MEPVKDPYIQYSELLIKAFEKIKKTVPKKYKELKEVCNEATGIQNNKLNNDFFFRKSKIRKRSPL